MKISRQRVRCNECPHECFCGSSQHIEQNHLGGVQHVPSLFLPYCQEHHGVFHVNCRRAGVDFRPISNKSLSLVQALKAHLVGLWMVVENLEKHIKNESEKGENDDKRA